MCRNFNTLSLKLFEIELNRLSFFLKPIEIQFSLQILNNEIKIFELKGYVDKLRKWESISKGNEIANSSKAYFRHEFPNFFQMCQKYFNHFNVLINDGVEDGIASIYVIIQ